jgi:periplasmic protein TonB
MNTLVEQRERPHQTTATLVLELDPAEDAPEPPKHTQQASEYKRHSLAARYWGEISRSEQPMRHIAAGEAQAVILRGLLQTPTDHRQKNPSDWILSVALHILIVGAVVLAPLAFTAGIDLRAFQLTHLAVPKPPAAAPLRTAAMEARKVVRPVRSAWLAPSVIPSRVETIKDPPAPDVSSEGVIGGIPGGETGGVLGGILGGIARGPIAPTATALEAKKTVHQVGGAVKPPRAVEVIQPNYPPVARTAHVEGVVVIDAIIDERGDVVEARAVSGPGLLIPAALKAIVQWKYEPTYLDGTPVPIRMEVQVEFHLH